MTAELEKAIKRMSLAAKKPSGKAAIWDYIDPALLKVKPCHARPIARLSAVGTRKATCASTPKAISAAKVTPKRRT